MGKIKFNDINFSSLQKLQQQGTKATIYRSGDICFKILDGLYEDEKELLYKKLIDMDGLTIPNVLLPKELIIKNGNIAFCDLDGCSYKEHIALFISILMKRFFIDYRDEKLPLSSNLDRISMLISFYYLIYAKEIQNLTKRQYHKLSDKISTLENAKMYANMLVDKSNYIGEIPYLDELINTNDDYIIDRDKQLSLVRRLLKR